MNNSSIFLMVAAGSLILVSTGCCKKDIAAEKARAEKLQAEAVAAAYAECVPVKNELATVKASLEVALEENTKLKQTPRYYFDQAVAKMNESKDEQSLKLFQDFLSRFPDDHLVQQVRLNIKQIESSIREVKEKRDRAAKGYLRSLTIMAEVCKNNKLTAAKALFEGTGGKVGQATLDRLWVDPPDNQIGKVYKDLRIDLKVKWGGYVSDLKLDDKRADLGEACYQALDKAEDKAFEDCFNAGLGDLKAGGTDTAWIMSVADSACR